MSSVYFYLRVIGIDFDVCYALRTPLVPEYNRANSSADNYRHFLHRIEIFIKTGVWGSVMQYNKNSTFNECYL